MAFVTEINFPIYPKNTIDPDFHLEFEISAELCNTEEPDTMDLNVSVEQCHEEALKMKEYMEIVKETETRIVERSAQVKLFSCRLVKHIHVVVDESKTITYKHRRKDNGNIEVFPVCDLYGAIRYNSKAEAMEVAKVYEQIRGHKVLSVTMLEALQADLLAAEGAVKVFKEFIEKM
ncbi:hypothetical protein [Burkholderia pseudomallei]|uniref:hypothetical protein n=1 Tax=Burkholderia pseudomallei TaxID=28450 RepID=UPI00105E20BD|nr:hypothetical protein [Burkholderia pseudomallei]